MGELDFLWSSRYEQRNLWRERAMESFINSLQDEEIKQLLRGCIAGTVPVSLYGKSQVGKTTFLLELMGIKSEYLDRIHDILRCGTKPGAPATPTAMIYKRTPEEDFTVHYQSNVLSFPNEEGIRGELASLRKNIEDGSYQLLEEIVIEIPERYFESKSELDILVCDLPGIESSNEDERPHVEQIIKKFIPLSALILVFQNGNEINSVSNLFNNEVMSEIYGWKYMTERYRLIITRAFTANSVEREISFDEVATSKSDIIDLYRREANLDAKNPDNVPKEVKIFPLELGKSLSDIPGKYCESRKEVIDSLMCELWSEIRSDIKITAESGNIVQRLSEIPFLLKRLIVDKEEEKTKLEDEFLRQIEEKDKVKLSYNINNQIIENKIRDIEAEINQLSAIENIKRFDFYQREKIRDDMIHFIDRTEEDFKHRINIINEQITLEQIEKWKQETHELFASIRNSLTKIWSNDGFFIFGPDQKHVNILNDRVSDLNNRTNDIYNEKIVQLKRYKIERDEAEKKKLGNTVISNSNQIQILEEEIHELSLKRNSKIEYLSKRIASYKTDLEKASSIRKFMISAVLEEKDNILSGLHRKSPVEAFLDLAYTALILKEYKKHINFNKE